MEYTVAQMAGVILSGGVLDLTNFAAVYLYGELM
jgi:hypothetical protein